MKKTKNRTGVTLVELMISMLVILILVTAAGTLLVDSHRGWVHSRSMIYGGAADDAAIAQAAFERIVRKASRSKYIMDGPDDLTVYLYANWDDSEYLDRYARFYRADSGQFYLEHGSRSENETEQARTTICLCTTVTDLEFKPANGGIQMKLTLDDGRQTTATVTTAILHNE